ncbi:MAG: tetratricopeptide repeat protein [Terriglobia bacterium]
MAWERSKAGPRAERRSAVQLLVLLLAALVCAAGFGSLAHGATPDPDDVALDQIHNLEYDAARQTLGAQLRLHPDDLRALNYLGNLTLDEELFREGLYSAEAYTNRGVATRQNRLEMPAGYEKKITDIFQQAQSAAEARLKQNPDDQDALYWAGVTHATRAEFYFTLERSYITSLHEGSAAYRLHQRLYRLNPGYTDALLVMGMGQYVAGTLPWYIKVLASIAGLRGSKAAGLDDLKQVTERGHYARDDARAILVVFYRREGMYAQAVDELQALARLFPANFLALTEMVRMDEAAGDWRSAARTADELVARLDSRAPGYEQMPAARILYETGKAHEHLGEMDQALRLYDRSATLPGKKPFSYQAELAAAHLELQLNHPAAARQRYQQIADAVPDTEEGKAARQALKEIGNRE